ncbi:acyltransferase family protein [Streptomyces sp. NPDC058991]|uniref:acyltransferase family protein n=1 Tax=unclassified Streptomyces TaxID=2593676 RepID=UPI00369BB7D4
MGHVFAPAVPSATTADDSPFRAPSTGRMIGLDLARGLAILGMFAAHVGPDPTVGGPLGWVMEVARGRSSALFALLAGFTLVLLTGRPRPRTGRGGRQAIGRVLIRAALLMVLGYALVLLDTDVDVILSFYGLLLVLALPLYRLSARTLALVAAATALVLPQVLYLLRAAVDGGNWYDAVVGLDPLARITGSDGFLELFVTGEYPALTWFPFIVAGMAVARLDLSRRDVLTKLACTGAALAVIGYGGSWLALHAVPGALAGVSAATDGGPAASAWWSDAVGEEFASGHPAWLLVASPHSQTTLSIVGNTGVAVAVLAGCLLAARYAGPRVRLLAPLAAVGSISLTAYVAHILAIRLLGTVGGEDWAALPVLLGFAVVAMATALVWTRCFRRGPLEYMLYSATKPARWIG